MATLEYLLATFVAWKSSTNLPGEYTNQLMQHRGYLPKLHTAPHGRGQLWCEQRLDVCQLDFNIADILRSQEAYHVQGS